MLYSYCESCINLSDDRYYGRGLIAKEMQIT